MSLPWKIYTYLLLILGVSVVYFSFIWMVTIPRQICYLLNIENDSFAGYLVNFTTFILNLSLIYLLMVYYHRFHSNADDIDNIVLFVANNFRTLIIIIFHLTTKRDFEPIYFNYDESPHYLKTLFFSFSDFVYRLYLFCFIGSFIMYFVQITASLVVKHDGTERENRDALGSALVLGIPLFLIIILLYVLGKTIYSWFV